MTTTAHAKERQAVELSMASSAGEGAAPDAELYGQKGAGLLSMCRLGLPVPPGFILPSPLFNDQDQGGHEDLLAAATASLVAECERRGRPLRFSVRSSPVTSMPGILETRLDVGKEDLPAAVLAVARSAEAPRAREYRRLYPLAAPMRLAVVVQAMVYGNRAHRSASGVVFSRDPSTGEPRLYGEFLPCAQGEAVVDGRQVPRPLAELAALLPEAYAALSLGARLLERHFGDVQDIEFTIEEGSLWFLQTRTARRSARAMVRISADLHREGFVSAAQALSRVEPRRLAELLRPTLCQDGERTLLTRGLPASPGVASGQIVFSSAAVEKLARQGEPAILVRNDTSTEDIVGIKLSAGILTARGGLTSHAAVVARGFGRTAVVGASALQVDAKKGCVSTREHTLQAGEIITVDGHSGEVFLGALPLSVKHLANDAHLQELLSLCRDRRLRVYSLCESAADEALCREFPADGIVRRAEKELLRPDPALPGSLEFGVATLQGAGSDDAGLLLLSADHVAEHKEATAGAMATLRAALPGRAVGLVATRLHPDAVELVTQAAALGVDFVVCPPLSTPIAIVAAAQL